MAVTFNDIAEKAGVSYSTVSRVINDHPAVSPEAAKRVKEVMKELGYEPPPPERRRGPMRGIPRKDLTGAVAFLFPDADARSIRTPLSAALIHGAEDYLYEQRNSLMVTHLREGDRLPVCLEKRQVDGVILRNGDLSPELINHLRSYPTVWIFQSDQRVDWADQVLPDNEAVGQLAVEQLLKSGARTVLCANFLPEHVSFKQRVRAFQRAADSAGVACNTIDMSESSTGALKRLKQTLSGKARPDGIFCAGAENETLEVCGMVRDAKLEPTKDIQVVSCVNDAERVRAVYPSLPNIDIQPEAIGRSAAERFFWRLENPKEPTQRLLITPRLDAP
jgi:LacI family transcriptional regulator